MAVTYLFIYLFIARQLSGTEKSDFADSQWKTSKPNV